ncbi:hypothetical protein ACA910_004995 [Epithemia clementina (nom. ined.)]
MAGFAFGSGGTPAPGSNNDNNNPNNASASVPFSFGGGAPAAPPATTMPAAGSAFSFGANVPAPSAPSAAPTTAFGANNTGTAQTTGVPAPAAGFTFGATTTTTDSTADTSTAASGGSLGRASGEPQGASAPTGTSAASAFSFGLGATASSSGPSASATSSGAATGSGINSASGQSAASYVAVPDFDTIFPGFLIAQQIRDDNNFEANSVATLLQVKAVWNQHTPNPTTRQKLHQERVVLLASSSDPNRKEEATLSDQMLNELFSLADDLALTEEQALLLLAKSKKQSKLTPEILYWKERQQHMETLLYIFQKRLALNDNLSSVDVALVAAANEFLQKSLVGELLQLISEYSQRLDRLIEKRRRSNAEAADDASRARQIKVISHHIDFASKQRQMAAETLFFIAYNFHLESDEVVGLLRLIRSLSAGDANNPESFPGLRPLNPHDVPSAYTHNTTMQQHPQVMWMEGFAQHSSTQLEEKNPFDWQNELVEQNWNQGHPQLLRCIATLLMTAVAVLDQLTPLNDRVSGESLAPSEDSTKLLLNKIHPELYAEEWKAPHVLGLLLASYALSLQTTNNPAITSPLSPRAGPSSPFHIGTGSSLNSDIRRTFRHALEAPALFKTFSFCRFSLIPALQIPTSQTSFRGCNVSEFLLAVLTELTAQFFGLLLRHNPPTSRAKWEQDAEEDLRLRRSDQENYRQFQDWSGTREKLEVIPDAVDLLQRPDCMDDVLALCYDVCYLGTNFASTFWAQQNVPSVLTEIESCQREDDSLLPGFLDLLSALSFYAPDLVHVILSGNSSELNGTPPITDSGDHVSISLNWKKILEMLRYYARELVNKGNGSAQNSSKRTNSSSTLDNSTTYYYYTSDDPTGNNKFSTSSTTSSSTSRELGERNTLILSSHLMLVESVASRSANARAFLRLLTLPIVSSESAVGQDSLWMILFSLTSAPLSPELRGLVFEALAATMDGSSEEELKHAWTCIEDYGILPIDKLLVYTTPIPEGGAPRIAFPPSSTARVNEKHCKSWIPANPAYSLIYEMEYIEASRGVYPSTGGFLRLLSELVQGGGCPADLGRNWRSQSGCSPYILYVIDLVLPRVTGTFRGCPALPFRCSGDRDRLLSLGFDVVAACLRRYIVPDFMTGQEPTVKKSLLQLRKDAEKLFTLRPFVDRLVVSTSDEEFKSYINDFIHPVPLGEIAGPGATVNQMIMNAGVPKPKSPGFLVLCELLNLTGSSLLEVVGKVLDDGVGRSNDVDKYATAFALYGSTPPTISSTKAGKNYPLKHLLLPLRTIDHVDIQRALLSRQVRIVALLETLCSAACREKQFAAALSVYAGSSAIVPIVKFQAKASAPDVREFQLSSTGQLLKEGEHLQSIVKLIGNQGDDVHWIDIARASTAFVFYLNDRRQNLSAPEPLVGALASILGDLSERCDAQDGSAELLRVILDKVLVFLHAKNAPMLLGIPILDVVLEALIVILNRHSMLKQAPALAAICYQILFRSMHFRSATESLSSCGFWTSHLGFVWSIRCENNEEIESNLWDSIGWILAGLAEELGHLGSSGYVLLPSDDTFVLRPKRYDQILDALLEENSLATIIAELPSQDSKLSEFLSWAIRLLAGGVVLSSYKLRNPFPVTELVQILLDHIQSCSFAPTSRFLALAVITAVDFQLATEEENLLSYAPTLAAIITRGGEGGLFSAATLTNILSKHEIPQDILPQHSLANGVSVLLRVSCATCDARSVPVEPKPEALLARHCLKAILPIVEERVVQRMLTDHGDFGQASTAVGTWIHLLASYDGDIISILKLITGFAFGSDMLLDGDILRVLDLFGERVIKHMQTLESNTIQSERVGVPVFWQEHLQFMTVLLLRASHGRQIEAANQVLRILSRYEPAVEKLFASFPRDGDTSLAYVKCCAIALDKAGSKQLSVPSSSPRTPALKSLCSLTRHISENPLPLAFLGRIPVSLTTRTIEDNLVTVVVDKQKSWWDSFDRNDWNEQLAFMFLVGAKAAEFTRLGFSIMRAGNTLEYIDCKSIATSLCRNVDALKACAYIEHQYLQSHANSDLLTFEDRRRFKNILCQSILEILRIAITFLKRQHETTSISRYGTASLGDFDQPLKVALDYTRLESIGHFFGDENTLASMGGVLTVLRTLIARK